MKKKTVLLVVVIAVAALLIAAALWYFLGGAPTQLYFNIDGASYQDPHNTARSLRRPDSSGVYHIDFATAEGVVTYTTKDTELVNRIDNQQVVALKVGPGGQIQSMSLPRNRISNEDVIQEIHDGELVLNSSLAYIGGTMNVRLAKDCRFYDLSNGGVETQPEVMDEVLIFGNLQGQATDVFVLRRLPHTQLYWRRNRKYDSKLDVTTRTPDENGVYTIPFAADGEQFDLKCKDMAVVTAVDAPTSSNAAMGLVLDEEGYITEVLPAYRTLRGREMCHQYDVTAIDGNRITVVNKLHSDGLFGRTLQLVLGEDCQFYDMSSGSPMVGRKADGVQLGDRVTVFADPLGIATHVIVHVRVVEGPLYFNLQRLYVNSKTARRPDAEGYYTFRMVCDGEVVTRKTKDVAIANRIDSISSRGMGLVCDGEVVERVIDVACVTGNSVLTQSRYVHSFTEAMVVTGTMQYGNLNHTMLQKDCKIYDVTDQATAREAKLQAGDCIIAFGDGDFHASHVFIVSRNG